MLLEVRQWACERLPILLLGAGLAASVPVLAQGARADDGCDEDHPTGEAPTIASRFDMADQRTGGTTFAQARERAAHWCAEQTCTAGGEPRMRMPSIYALGIIRGRFIAGFKCAASMPARSAAARELTFTFAEPSGIDDALAKGNRECAPAKAELVDLQKRADGILATFVCSR